LVLYFSSIYILIICCKKEKPSEQIKLTSLVNPFIGTDGPGNTYPGATVPFGMVQLSPDIGIPGWDRIAGYFIKILSLLVFTHTFNGYRCGRSIRYSCNAHK
jgi:putative alpha-1,2-mannosidase